MIESITLRAGGAFFTSFLILFFAAPRFIKYLKVFQHNGQPIRAFGPESHLTNKQGTPTMGGIMIILSIVLSSLVWSKLNNAYVWLSIFLLVSFGIIGASDDLHKLRANTFHGIRPRSKLLLQIIFATIFIIGYYLATPPSVAAGISFPFFKDFILNTPLLHAPLAVFVILSFSNAVNLTDGLDGLASFPSLIACLCFGAIAYMGSHAGISAHLGLPHLPQIVEMFVFGGAMSGALLAFLWYNALPAQVFMGDTGSLSLGATLGGFAVIIKQEFLSALICVIFVAEVLSVILQVTYFKYTGGKRLFLMSPLHHHFEKKGWSEATIVKRFWILSILFATLGLLAFKVRI